MVTQSRCDAVDKPPLHAVNRGILTGAAFAITSLLSLELSGSLYAAPDVATAAYAGVTGFAGTFVVLSARRDDRHRPGFEAEFSDLAVTSLWIAVALLGANLIWPFTPPATLFERLLASVFGIFVGGVTVPWLLTRTRLAKLRTRRPFSWAQWLADRAAPGDAHYLLTMGLHTLAIAATLAAFAASIFITLTLLLTFVVLRMIAAMFGMLDDEPRVSLSIPRGGQIDRHGVIRGSGGLLKGVPTGDQVRERDGRVVRQGMLFDVESELRIVDDEILGRDDQPTGLGFETVGDRRHLVRRDGDDSARLGVFLDSTGRPKKSGFFGAEDVQLHVSDQGQVYVDGELV